MRPKYLSPTKLWGIWGLRGPILGEESLPGEWLGNGYLHGAPTQDHQHPCAQAPEPHPQDRLHEKEGGREGGKGRKMTWMDEWIDGWMEEGEWVMMDEWMGGWRMGG